MIHLHAGLDVVLRGEIAGAHLSHHTPHLTDVVESQDPQLGVGHRIPPGDRIAFGPVECSFVLPDRALPHAESPAAAEAAPGRGGWSVGRIAIIGAVSFVLTLVVVYLLMK